ncbi:PH domain-containing protein [Sinomonas sp. JGH33]|uniref:PH domain-containing protein n=1 Tax=Sinomonas terricola TaxID=3110330 RepID=A0ABU5T4W1_9MICC|nr:PH domain-containing protein [Sinomonas sp. JGH33]MEA5454704.1 PH domain-containing protein [Sinomonas sp. JGH33]
MRKLLVPGEQVIVDTRRHGSVLVLPALVAVLVCGGVAFAAGWLTRGRLDALLPWLPPGTGPWLALAPTALGAWIVVAYPLRRLIAWGRLRYTLTSQRVLRRERGLRRSERELPLAMVRDVAVHQSVLQSLARSGTITLTTGQAASLRLDDVPEVRSFRQLVLDAIDELPAGVGFPGADDGAWPGPAGAAPRDPWQQDPRRQDPWGPDPRRQDS